MCALSPNFLLSAPLASQSIPLSIACTLGLRRSAKTVAVAVTPPTATTAQDESCDTVITAITNLRKEEVCIYLFSEMN
jgi:hypothetical protein